MSKKPRIAIYYNNQLRNDGPPLYYFNVLKNQLKLDVTHLLPSGDTRRYGKFDLHFWVDFGEDSFLSPEQCAWMPPADGGKTIYVCSDAHIDKRGHDYRFQKAAQFDYVFFNQIRAFEEYTGWKWGKHIDQEHKTTNGSLRAFHRQPINQYVGFLPHAAEPTVYNPAGIYAKDWKHALSLGNRKQIKKYDVAFIGHVQDQKNNIGVTRIEALDRLFKEFPNFYFGTRNPASPAKNMFEDAARAFTQAKIVFNISIGDDINMRLFEIAATRSFQLSNWLPTLHDIGLRDDTRFQVNETNIATYNTLDEMVEKTRFYLENDDLREQIAQAGYDWFINGHTYRHRVEKILEVVGFPVRR